MTDIQTRTLRSYFASLPDATGGRAVTKGLETVAIPQPVFRGEYDNSTEYTFGDQVSYEGSTWVARLTTIANPPPTLPDELNNWWFLVSRVGGPGPQGEQGEQGPPGQDGIMHSIVAGENVTVDDTDPANPIISVTSVGSVSSVNGQTGDVVLAAGDVGAATAAQGAKADTALQPAAIGVSVQAHSAILDATTASFTTALLSKLNGISSGATANQSDAYLLSRANHTGTQLAATISDFSTAADLRIAAAVGVSVQAYSAKLGALSALTWAADKLPYFTSASAVATADLSAFVRGILGSSDAAAFRTAIGAPASPYSAGGLYNVTASVAAVDIPINATKKRVRIEFDGVQYASTSAALQIFADVSGNVFTIPISNVLVFSNGLTAVQTTTTNSSTTGINITDLVDGSTANRFVSGVIELSQLSGGHMAMIGRTIGKDNTPRMRTSIIGGQIETTSAVASIRFKSSSGNITAGRFVVTNLD